MKTLLPLFLALSACAVDQQQRASTTLDAADVLEFVCKAPVEADGPASVRAFWNDVGGGNLIVTALNGESTAFHTSRHITPPGADESHKAAYESNKATLIIAVEPDLMPTKGHKYQALFNGTHSLACEFVAPSMH